MFFREKDNNPIPREHVFSLQHFTWPRYTVDEAINTLRDFYDPTLFDNPNGLLRAKLRFERMVPIYHKYDEDIPSKTVYGEYAREAGATMVGGDNLIMEIAKGRVDISDIEYFLAHEDMVLNLKPLNSLLRDKLPRNRMLPLEPTWSTWSKPYQWSEVAVKKVPPSLLVEDEPDYGYCIAEVGRLQMDSEKLKENINGILLALGEKYDDEGITE
ncbi:39S ribosomal protein L1_ mitochondrial [Caligus rogercresseyi]|uniref:39S ribosomal protein L1_ mitochondrial n=1 Tax=Caligus rogercresseyi TaxID=217165 RepID=A0A7T8H2W2_CALRO|nr:39S ribosomal protein L1_ mitochondrial [Caligus rogercresseyi]